MCCLSDNLILENWCTLCVSVLNAICHVQYVCPLRRHCGLSYMGESLLRLTVFARVHSLLPMNHLERQMTFYFTVLEPVEKQ